MFIINKILDGKIKQFKRYTLKKSKYTLGDFSTIPTHLTYFILSRFHPLMVKHNPDQCSKWIETATLWLQNKKYLLLTAQCSNQYCPQATQMDYRLPPWFCLPGHVSAAKISKKIQKDKSKNKQIQKIIDFSVNKTTFTER